MHALILVDIQNDFLSGGALAVPEGDRIIPAVNALLRDAERGAFDVVVATQDWHPANHGSFAATHAGRKVGDLIDLNGLQQMLWPVHCVQGSRGAEVAPALNQEAIQFVVRKGTDPAIDSYSGFFDNGHRKATGLDAYLREKNVKRVTIVGLATDYCVKFTAMDAKELGYETTVIQEACRGVNVQAGDVDRAILEMKARGVAID